MPVSLFTEMPAKLLQGVAVPVRRARSGRIPHHQVRQRAAEGNLVCVLRIGVRILLEALRLALDDRPDQRPILAADGPAELIQVHQVRSQGVTHPKPPAGRAVV
jgi:hypothetical protein